MSDKEQNNTCCNGDNCIEFPKPKFKTELNLIQINSVTEPEASCQDDCCSTPEPKMSCQDDGCSAETEPKGDESDLSEVTGHKSEFRVHGMDCPACALTIEKSIGQLENIKNVSVNITNDAKKDVFIHSGLFLTFSIAIHNFPTGIALGANTHASLTKPMMTVKESKALFIPVSICSSAATSKKLVSPR